MRKKNNINFTSRLAVAKKISIKALDFEKLPQKFNGANYIGNAFLNITRSSSNRGGKDNLTSSLTKNKGKMLFAKPLTSRSRNENAIKLNVIPKTTATIINITQCQKNNMNQINNKQQKPINKLFAQSLYASYNNSSTNYKNFNTNAAQNLGNNPKSLSGLNKMDSKSSSRNLSKNSNIMVNNSTFSSAFINSKDNSNITSGTIEKIKRISNMGANKINNKNNVNDNMSLTRSTLSSHNNISGYNYNNPNINANININSYNTKVKKNTNKHFSNSNISSLSHKKLGIKVKKKTINSSGGKDVKADFCNMINNNNFNNNQKEKEKDNDINNKKNLSKLMQIPLFKNFNKLKTFIIWRNFIHQNSFEYKYLSICDIVENKIIKNYYLNGIIGKYNNILKEELIWNNYPVPQDFLDIDEKNKDELLLNLYEKALNTYKNLIFSNNKILASASIYIFELMVNKLYQNIKKIRFIMKYYYDKEKKAIIKKPSVTVIKEILNKLNKIIERPNIKNKIAQEFIIHNSKIIGNLNLNKSQVKPIITQYLELYKGNKAISQDNLKENFIYGNIINDFTALQKNKGDLGISGIMKEIKKCENLIIFSYTDNENLEIILYKLQPIKYNLNIIEQKILAMKNNNSDDDGLIEENKKENKNKLNELNNICIKLKERLELVSNVIENKYGKFSMNEKILNLTDIKFVTSFIEFLLIKQNIVYNPDNQIKGIEILMEQNDSQRNKKIFDAYNKYNENNKGINFDYIHFLIVSEKLKNLIKNKKSELNYYNNLISFKEEFYTLYNKLWKDKAKLQNNELNNVNSLFNEINKHKYIFENIKDEISEIIKDKDKENPNKTIDYELFYKDIISRYIKYDKDKENNDKNENNTIYKKEIALLEKILFRHISLIKNKEENNFNNLNSIITLDPKTLDDFPKISQELKDYYYSNKDNNKRDFKLLSKIYDELKSKNYFNKSSTQSQESVMPYPKLYFLSDHKLEKIKSTNKISIIDISKYFSKINNLQELEINTHHNKNNITGIKIFNETKKEYEFFKFLTQIPIPNTY